MQKNKLLIYSLILDHHYKLHRLQNENIDSFIYIKYNFSLRLRCCTTKILDYIVFQIVLWFYLHISIFFGTWDYIKSTKKISLYRIYTHFNIIFYSAWLFIPSQILRNIFTTWYIHSATFNISVFKLSMHRRQCWQNSSMY